MRIPLIMAIIAGVFSIIVDLYIYFDLRKNFPKKSSIFKGYGWCSIACWVFLLLLLCIPKKSNSANMQFLMWGFFSYLTVYSAKLIFVIFSIIGCIPLIFKKNRLKLGKWVGLPLAVILFIAIWWGSLVTRRQIEVTRTEIFSSRIPEGFNDYRIVQISDLHVGTWGEDTSFFSALVDTINNLRPDIIFFTGDIVNRETSELAPFLTTFSRLKAPDGVWSVLGNHDYGDYLNWPTPDAKRANLQLLKNWERQIGWNLMNNESADITRNEDTIRLIGVENWGEPPFYQYGHLIDAYPLSKDSMHNLNDSKFKILLSHNPEHWRREVSKISNIDLTLSGHTHAMQIEFRLGNWKWSPSAWRYKQWGGLYQTSNANGDTLNIYVNIGAGEVGLPFRIGATPEVSLLTLKRNP